MLYHYFGSKRGVLDALIAEHAGGFMHELAAARLAPEQRQVLAALFESAARDHGNLRGRQERYAASFLGVLAGYATLLLDSEILADAGLAHQVMHQFSHGIYS